jgi:hypothetical protein
MECASGEINRQQCDGAGCMLARVMLEHAPISFVMDASEPEATRWN